MSTVVNILLWALLALRIIIGIRLVILARQNSLQNIYWLAAQYFLVAVGLAFVSTEGNPLGYLPFSLWVYNLFGFLIPQVTVIAFNQTTFYQGRTSPIRWYIGAYILASLVGLYGLVNSESAITPNTLTVFFSVSTLLLWTWHGWCSYHAYRAVSGLKVVEDWIKARYQLIIAYSIALVISAVINLIRIPFMATATNSLAYIMVALTLVMNIVAVSLQFLTWVMPAGFRNWLNRSYQTPAEMD
jgi:hypothetical protein